MATLVESSEEKLQGGREDEKGSDSNGYTNSKPQQQTKTSKASTPSMDDHHQHHVFFILLLLPFTLATFNPIDNYLLSCGSATTTTLSDGSDDRSFLPDSTLSSTQISLSIDGSIPLINPNNNNPTDLYRTTRFFPQYSTYTFQINKPDVHILRLHFYPFSTPTHNLFSSIFDVSVSGFLLLSSFFPEPNSSSASYPLVLKEFYLKINVTQFTISFSASGFVSAIEVISAPDELVQDVTIKILSSSDDIRLTDQVLETVYRVNVGGLKVTPVNDSLWRTWIPDDEFLETKSLAMATPSFSSITYLDGGPTIEIAPVYVYGTAREMNTSGNSSSAEFNLTWAFPVSSDHRYFVRMHFCDIISQALYTLYFNSYINGYSAGFVDLTSATTINLQAPHFIDSILDVNGTSMLRISVGPSNFSEKRDVNAILNGLEIMKVNGAVLLSEPSPGKKSTPSMTVGAIVGISTVVVIVVVVLAVVIVLIMFVPRRREHRQTSSNSLLWSLLSRFSSRLRGTSDTPFPDLNLELNIPLTDIILATNNFAEKNKIGSGGFGLVYKGVLQDGTKVAVKRGSRKKGQGLAEFHNEIMVLSKSQHCHLVSFIGYCDEQGEMILVFEFMEKGTLQDHLYCSTPGQLPEPPLSWKQRLEICIGSARGLRYLHTGTGEQGIIHHDVKSANILLDENLTAKVADFGISKLVHTNEAPFTIQVRGTPGYMDPEYARTFIVTQKSDVYSFGVVLLEVLCGRKALDNSLPEDHKNLAEWGLKNLENGHIDQIMDPSLMGSINPNALRKFVEIIENCLKREGSCRPSMEVVEWDLEYTLKLQELYLNHELYDDTVLDITTVVPSDVSDSMSVLHIRDPNRGLLDVATTETVTGVSGSHDDSQSLLSRSEVFSQLIPREGR